MKAAKSIQMYKSSENKLQNVQKNYFRVNKIQTQQKMLAYKK